MEECECVLTKRKAGSRDEACFELRSTDPTERSEVEVKGNNTKEYSNYSPEPCLFLFQ